MTDKFIVRGIPALLIPRMWAFAEPYIKRALDHSNGELDSDDLRAACEKREVQLWLVSTGDRVVGAATTEIAVYPQRKHCRVITIAGSQFAEWIELVDETLATWALAMGCDAMEAHVRKGLVPKLAPLNYRHAHSVIYKKLDIITEIPVQQAGG